MADNKPKPSDLMVCVALASSNSWLCSDEVRGILNGTYGWDVTGAWTAAALRRLRLLELSPVDTAFDRYGYGIWSYQLNWRGLLWLQNAAKLTLSVAPSAPRRADA